MNSTLPSVLLAALAILVAGCGARDNRVHQQTEAPHEDEPEKAESVDSVDRLLKDNEMKPVFPNIEARYRKDSLDVIESYCTGRGIGPLGKNRVRLFVQPMGIVSEAIEVDFASRTMTVHPGTHGKGDIVHTLLDEDQIAQIRALVVSPEFRKIPSENRTVGLDGTSFLMEASIDDAYYWVLHWSPDDEYLIRVVDQIRNAKSK